MPSPRSQHTWLGQSLPLEVCDPVLNGCLWLAGVLWTAPLIIDAVYAPTPPWGKVGFWVHASVQALVLLAAVWKKGPILFRIGALLGLGNMIVIESFAYTGATPHVPLLLTFCVLFSGVFLGGRAMTWSFGLALLWYALGYVGWHTGFFPLSSDGAAEGRPDARYWLEKSTGFGLSCGAIVALVRVLVRRLVRHKELEHEAEAALAREQQLRVQAELLRLHAERDTQAAVRQNELELSSMFAAAPVGILRPLIRITLPTSART